MRPLDALRLAPSRDAVARSAIAQARRLGSAGDVRFDPADFRLVFADGISLNLHNLHADVCRAWPWQRRAIVRRYLAALVAETPRVPDFWPSARDLLLPSLRSAGYLANVGILRSSDAAGVVWRPFDAGLVCFRWSTSRR